MIGKFNEAGILVSQCRVVQTSLKSEYILNKRFEIGRMMHNTTLKFAIKQLKKMRENKTYKQTLKQYLEYKKLDDKDNIKLYSNLLNSIKLGYSLIQRQMYKEHIDINTAQKIASTAYKAVEDVLYKKGKIEYPKNLGIKKII